MCLARRLPARPWTAPRSRHAANRRLHPALVRRRRLRWLLLIGIPLGASLVFLACRTAFQEGLFRVREITFRGLVHAQPAVLVAEAGLARPRSMFDDFAFVAANLARDPLVREVHVHRELPARLVVEIQERAPAAYWAADSTLLAVDAEGRVLPLDPARFGWDLPVLMASRPRNGASGIQAGRIVDGDARALLRLVIGIRDRVPEISRRISTAELEPGGRVALHLMGQGGEVRLRLETPMDKVALLPEVLRDLELKQQGFESLDLSFQDQIVVRPVELAAGAGGESSAVGAGPAGTAAATAGDAVPGVGGGSVGTEPFTVEPDPAARSDGLGPPPPAVPERLTPVPQPPRVEPLPAADPDPPGPAARLPSRAPADRAGLGANLSAEPFHGNRPA